MTMRARVAAVFLALFVWSTAVGGGSLPDHCAILPISQGPALIRQCSRSSPTAVSSFWSPSASQVLAVEQRLSELLRESGHKLKISDSFRQYVGVTSYGKKLIYLNCFPEFALDHSSDRQIGGPRLLPYATAVTFSGASSLIPSTTHFTTYNLMALRDHHLTNRCS